MVFRRHRLPSLATLAFAGLALLPLAAPARAAEPTATVLPTVERTLAVAAPARHTCSSREYGKVRGVSATRWQAPMDGVLSARMRGPAADDWDLALFDSTSGRLLDGSAGFGSNELATGAVRAGDAIVVQACRRSGSSASVPVSLAFAAVERETDAERASQVEVTVTSRAEANRLVGLGLDVNHDAYPGPVKVNLFSDAERAELRAAGLEYREVVHDLAAQDRRDRDSEAAYARRVGGESRLTSGRTTYREYVDYQNDLKALAEDHPTFIRPVILPLKSVQGRDIEGVEIAKDVDATDDGRPVYVEMGLHHSREWPSAEAVMEYGLDLAAGFGPNPRITRLVENERTFVIPVINPDGFISSRQFGYAPGCDDDPTGACSLPAAAAGTGAYRRKNCRDDPNDAASQSDPCEALKGVDLNRNYGAYWGGDGASANWMDQTFRGPSPYSEPEAEAVHRWSAPLQITTFITNHNVAALVLRPPSFHDLGLAPDEDRLKILGDAMAAATGYSSEYGYQLYDVTGATEDWNYVAQGSFGYTIELGGPGFHAAYQDSVIDEYEGAGQYAGKGVREAFLLAGEQAMDPTDHSIIEGSAPPGATLRIQKTFFTTTSNVQDADGNEGEAILLPDHLETALTVPPSGRYTWHVNPSTRPFVLKEGGREAWTMTCELGGAVKDTREVFVARGEVSHQDFGCPTPATTGTTTTPAGACADRAAPSSRVRRVRRTRTGRIVITGRTTDAGCTGTAGAPSVKGRVARVRVALARASKGGKCRFVTRKGRFGKPRSCKRPRLLRARGTSSWKLTIRTKLALGRYRVLARATDGAGNDEALPRPAKFRVR